MAITKLTTEQKLAIERKTAKTLPDQPTARGYSAETIRRTLYKWLSDPTNSIFAYLDAMVDEANTAFANIEGGTTDIDYDNAISGLVAITIKAAIDELDGILDDVIAGTQNIAYDNATSGLAATVIKAAIDELDSEIDDIKSGATAVAVAVKATKDSDGNTINVTYEKLANKKTSLVSNSDTDYPSVKAVKTYADNIKNDLVSGTTVVAEATKATKDANDDDIHTTYIKSTEKGAAGGVVPLTSGSIIDPIYIPGAYTRYVEVATHAALPVTGTEAVLYVVIADETSGDNTSSYRWTGSVYVKMTDLLSASEVKSLYESNADTNAYTDAEKSKLASLQDGSNYYTKAQVDTLLDQLTTAWGLTETAVDELAHNETVALATLTDYDYITLYLKHTDTHFIFDGKLIDPAVFVNNGDMIQLNAWENGIQHSYGKITYCSAFGWLTFTASDTADTLVIKGYKKEAISSDLVTTEHTGTNYLDAETEVKGALEALDAQIKADVDDLADVVAGTTDIVIDEEDITATTIREAILEVNAKAVANADTKEALSNKAIDFSVVNDIKYPTTKAVKDLIDTTVGDIETLLGGI